MQTTFESTVLMPLEERDTAYLRDFLARALNKPPDTPAFTIECLHWKYFHPRQDWPLPRSWAFKDQHGQIVAHIGVGPLTFVMPHTSVSTIMMMDWAAARSHRGIGTRLMEEVTRNQPFRFNVGGTNDAQRSLARQGYDKIGTMETFSRPIRPWRQLRDTPRPLERWHIGRWLRESQSNRRVRRFARRLSAVRIQGFESLRSLLQESDRCGWTRAARSPELLDYMLACPADCRAYALYHDEKPVGYVMLAHRATQARVADLWIASDDDDLWRGAFAITADLARHFSEAWELTAISSTPKIAAALQANGFRSGIRRPIWLQDPSRAWNARTELHLQALESDSWFL
jgi:hypothetical protein